MAGAGVGSGQDQPSRIETSSIDAHLLVASLQRSGISFNGAQQFSRGDLVTNVSDRMAPPDKAGLYVELSSREPQALEALLPAVAEGLCDMRIIDHAREIRFARLRRIDHAYVVFDHAYYPSLQAIQPFLEAQRIFSSGRYGGWNYSSMEDALLFGQKAAEQAQRFR